jgi:hypothetical protein
MMASSSSTIIASSIAYTIVIRPPNFSCIYYHIGSVISLASQQRFDSRGTPTMFLPSSSSFVARAAAEIVGKIGHDRFSELQGEYKAAALCSEERNGLFSHDCTCCNNFSIILLLPVLLLLRVADDIMRRISEGEVKTLEDNLPNVDPEFLLLGNGPKNLQEIWDDTMLLNQKSGGASQQRRLHWIY